MEVGLGPGHIVLDGDLAHPSPKEGRSPQFLAHLYCGQMAGWIKMALGMEVGLGPGHIVLDGDPAPLKKGTAPPPNFSPCLLWQRSGWMKMPLSMEVDLSPGHYHTKWHLHPSSSLVTTNMGRKLGAVPPFGEGKLGPRLAKCHMAWVIRSAVWPL